MLNLLADYMEIRPRIDDTVENFLNTTAARSLLQLIQDKSFSVVYSYPASQRALMTRRYTIGDEDAMSVNVAGGELTIRDTMKLQHDDGSYEADIVQEGYSNYKQPGPRPFMEEALREYIESGRADAELADALEAAGFEVERI